MSNGPPRSRNSLSESYYKGNSLEAEVAAQELEIERKTEKIAQLKIQAEKHILKTKSQRSTINRLYTDLRQYRGAVSKTHVKLDNGMQMFFGLFA